MVLQNAKLSPGGRLVLISPRKKRSSSKPKKESKPQRKVQPPSPYTYTEQDMVTYRTGLYYEKRMMEINGYRRKFFSCGPTKSHKSWAHFEVVVAQANALGMEPEKFVEAQFWFYTKNYQRLPSPFDLCPYRPIQPSPAAVAKMWIDVYGESPSYYAPAKKPDRLPIDNEKEKQFYDRVLERTMRLFNLNKEEALCVFGERLFSPAYLSRFV